MKFETNFKHKEHHEQQTTSTTSSNTSLNKSNSFCLKSFLEKTKNKVLNNANCSNSQCCHQHRLQTRTNRSSFKIFNHHNHHHHHHHHKINIIKPIALRPNQTDLLLLKQEKTINCLNELNNNFRFSSIDSINSLNKSPTICMQRRATVPRVNLKNLSINYVLSATTNENECVQQRPGLNLIKMKLQRFLNENRSSDDLFKLKTFDILSLSALNLNGKHHHKQQNTKSMRLNNTQINCYNTNLISNSSSVSSLSSSVNQNNLQMCLSSSSSSNESELDIAQIENDLNF